MRGEKRRGKKGGYACPPAAPVEVTLEPQHEPSLPHFCPFQFQELLFCCATQRRTVTE